MIHYLVIAVGSFGLGMIYGTWFTFNIVKKELKKRGLT